MEQFLLNLWVSAEIIKVRIDQIDTERLCRRQ
jgi:hypothetical protein